MMAKIQLPTILKFSIKLLVIFFTLYLGTLFLIGITSPGNYYNLFIDEHLNYVRWLKQSLQYGVVKLLKIVNISTTVFPNYQVSITNGRSILINNSCVGYGVYSFWIAYIMANNGKLLSKLSWIFFGLLLIWFINVLRISLFLYTVNHSRRMPLGLDHHTWFNIAAYGCIFIMMYFFETRKQADSNGANTAVTKREHSAVISDKTHE